MSAVRTSMSRSASASTSIPSMPSVPLINARPSLARSVTGGIPAADHRLGAFSLTDQGQADVCQRARSPLAPSDPCSCTAGVMSAFSNARIVSTTT